jgi:hypothetical protein
MCGRYSRNYTWAQIHAMSSLERAGWNVQRESHVVLRRRNPRGASVMRFSDHDDHDIGAILLTVIVTVVLGAMVYAYNSWGNLQTAYMPAFERTVPTIVQSRPGL